MGKHVDPYPSDGAPRTGLVVSMGVLPVAVPIPVEDIVWPDGQQFDADGRPLTVMEMEQQRHSPSASLAA